MTRGFDARGLFSLLFHGDKAIDTIQAAYDTGLLGRLDAGPFTLEELASELGMVQGRLSKFLDCLESLGVVRREQELDDIAQARFVSREPLEKAAALVVGPDSIERDRNTQPWRHMHGRMPEVLQGGDGIPPEEFAWPPATPEQRRRFEQSMAAGLAPIVESFAEASALWGGPQRVLDVGGGDGSLACALVERHPGLRVDVYNLQATEDLVRERIAICTHQHRLGFVAGDFFEEPLPHGYDALSFVRVLHDWPERESRGLIEAAFVALEPGGRIVISEEMRTPDRLAVQFFWTYFLVGVDSCVSRLREADWYRRVLEEVGFTDVEVRPGAFDIVTATR